MYVSSIGPNELVIDDSNFGKLLLPEGTVVSGEPISYGMLPRDWDAEPFGSAPCAPALPDELIINDDKELLDHIERLERTKTRISDLYFRGGYKSLHQNGTNFCWYNCLVSAKQALNAIQNQPFCPLSPASGAAPIKNFRNVGGWATQALKWDAEHGTCPLSLWPANAINRRYYTDEARAEALKHRVTEWYDVPPRFLRAVLSLVVRRIPVPVGFNWWRHAVCGFDAVHFGNYEFGLKIMNSHGEQSGDRGLIILRGNKAIPDDACAPRVELAA